MDDTANLCYEEGWVVNWPPYLHDLNMSMSHFVKNLAGKVFQDLQSNSYDFHSQIANILQLN